MTCQSCGSGRPFDADYTGFVDGYLQTGRYDMRHDWLGKPENVYFDKPDKLFKSPHDVYPHALDDRGYYFDQPDKVFRPPHVGYLHALDPCNGGVPFTVIRSIPACTGVNIGGGRCVDPNVLIIGGVAAAAVVSLLGVYMIRKRKKKSSYGDW